MTATDTTAAPDYLPPPWVQMMTALAEQAQTQQEEKR